MTEKGFLTASEEPKGSRKKIYYHTTEAGKKQFFNWLSTPMDIFEGTNTHLAKVYFFDKLPEEIRERQLFKYEINNRTYLKKLEELESQYIKMTNRDCFYYKLSTLYYGICITQKTILWCEHIRMQKPLSDLIESR